MRTGDGNYHVLFYGTYEAGQNVLPGDVWAFMDNRDSEKFGKSKKTKIYKQALWEIANFPEIVDHRLGKPEEAVSSGELEVEKILSRRRNGGDWEFKVLWKAGDISWEPKSHLINCEDLLKELDDRAALKLKLKKTSRGLWETRSSYSAANPNDAAADPMCRHTSLGHATKVPISTTSQSIVPTVTQSIVPMVTQSIVPTVTHSIVPTVYQSIASTRFMLATTSQSMVACPTLLQLDESNTCSSPQPVPSCDQELRNIVRTDSSMTNIVRTDSSLTNIVTDDNTMAYTGGIQDADSKPSRDPRDWTYDQVVGELCRMDSRLLFKDLGPLLDKKVAGDVLLRCSLDVLQTALKLDFNTAMRVTDQIARLKLVVKRVEEIVIK
eukprot:GFUD01115870.1.p1 GENE.GFUD01115870.1~~GFUD01115870.1.p1  ORF type:complete len:445 (+),score=109.02 GFUD01115870.1:193-1335(+)